ncbi:regulatory protein GemA [Desulfuromonas acetoxidans]|uniref:Regulatory protein GemA n=1 Tax=Desulfuromonas acetoxidans (strain DSM 684 / 11070) TaxID=281689 RepID=Q1JYR8_DESA6|nr:regulatory protein GemA [Desulfuromonas acetoxidans]EAT15347.1 hypothetical protein Dace_1011 [Desulfuromonas acetoxidans DSM 684]MBF0646409.1 regulatory protein GemA [Desulfuromonas acetoxidans]NVD24376.1 regulatory protein GemA [Desulfuromonas acetoxidans]NVE16676.1 regulatory protein GemA [Desulfuromonas acetoxidans]
MRTKQEIRPITKQQVKMIHTLKEALGLNESIYRGTLYDAFGVTSSKELNETQACGVIDCFKKEAIKAGIWEQEHDYSSFGNRPDHATPKQLKYICCLWNQVSRVQPDRRDAALRKFLMRQAGVADLRFLKRSSATKVISALKAMKTQAGSVH